MTDTPKLSMVAEIMRLRKLLGELIQERGCSVGLHNEFAYTPPHEIYAAVQGVIEAARSHDEPKTGECDVCAALSRLDAEMGDK